MQRHLYISVVQKTYLTFFHGFILNIYLDLNFLSPELTGLLKQCWYSLIKGLAMGINGMFVFYIAVLLANLNSSHYTRSWNVTTCTVAIWSCTQKSLQCDDPKVLAME